MSTHIAQMIENCSVCARDVERRREPLVTTPLPDYPWQMVGSDLFQIKNDHYLLVVDYFSRYPEVVKLSSTTTSAVILAMKSMFSRHGIPETIRSDNGPQYSSQEFKEFSESYMFRHVTSSPHFPQSNGMAERMVKTTKRLLQRSDDPYLALLIYRSTPIPWCGFSPAELLMGRCLRATLPLSEKKLVPGWSYVAEFRQRDQAFKKKQKKAYDKRHRVAELPIIPDDTKVWVTSGPTPTPGRVTTPSSSPRSYLVETPSGIVRRNRFHLNISPEGSPTEPNERESSPPRRIMTRTQTGTEIRPPARYRDGLDS